MSAVEFRDVSFAINGRTILNRLSFVVEAGETLVLLGETGTGKTLSLKMAAGLLRPQQGEVNVLGHRVSEMVEKELLAFRCSTPPTWCMPPPRCRPR